MAEDAEIVEAVARAIMESMAQQHVTDDQWATALQSGEDADTLLTWATAALSAARPLIERAARKEALEEAARVAEDYDSSFDTLGDRSISWDYVDGQDAGREAAAQDIAQAIRALDEGGGK